MRLLFISTQVSPPWGGGEMLWSEAALQAIAEDYEVHVAVSARVEKHPKLVKLEEKAASVQYWPTAYQPLSWVQRVCLRLGLASPLVTKSAERWHAIRHGMPGPPDVICVSQGGTYCALNTPGLDSWLLEQPVPFVLVCHSNRIWARPCSGIRSKAKALFSAAGAVCFVAPDNLIAARRFLAMDLPQGIVVQNPVNLPEVTAVPWPALDCPTFATVARLVTQDKGQDLLIEVLARQDWKERVFRLNLYGSGADHEYLADLIAFHHLEERVFLLGHEPDIRSVWSRNHMLVLPSISEGTPLSLIEAMICGRPAVVTAVDGNADWVEDGKSGFIASAPTVTYMAQALESAWTARSSWMMMGEAARQLWLVKRDPSPIKTFVSMLVGMGARRKASWPRTTHETIQQL